MQLEMNLTTLKRLDTASAKLVTVARRAKRLTEQQQVALYQRAQYLFIEAKAYVLRNAGLVPPDDARLWFNHSERTLQYISKASADIRKLWNLIPPSKQAEASGANAQVMQMLKDLATHVRFMMKRGR